MSAAGRAVCGGRETQWFVAGPAVLDGEDLRSAAFSSVATGCRPASAGGIRNVVSLVSAVVVNPFSSGDHCGLRGSAHRERGLVARIWESIKDEPVLSGSHGEEAVVVRCRGNLSDPMPSILEARSRSRGGARWGRDGIAVSVACPGGVFAEQSGTTRQYGKRAGHGEDTTRSGRFRGDDRNGGHLLRRGRWTVVRPGQGPGPRHRSRRPAHG